jgi:hypothetical protein
VMWVMWNLVLVRLDMVLGSVQDRCTVCTKCTIWSEIVLDALMLLLGDEAQVEACFSSFGDSANLYTRSVHSLRQAYHRLINHFGHTR